MTHPRSRSLAALPILALIFAVLCGAPALQAKDPPSDPCALLPPAQLEKVLEQPFGAPIKGSAPPPYKVNSPGTQCSYRSSKGPSLNVIFIFYADSSPAVAKDTFDKLTIFYGFSGPNTPVSGIGDVAYRDSKNAIHVLKGNVRYFINVSSFGTLTPQKEKQLNALAAGVAAQL